MTKLAIKLVVVAITAFAAVVWRWQAQRRAEQAERVGGCLACGSQRVVVNQTERSCLECGFTGRADGGGQLSAQEIDAMYDHSQDRRDW